MFLLAEVTLRLVRAKPQTVTVLTSYFRFSDQTGWTGRPNAASRFCTTNFDVFITHGPDGLRSCGLDTTIGEDKPESEVVWCVGDSGTWGWGVGDGETYVDRLNNMDDSPRVYRNLGMCGFSSVQEYLLLKEYFKLGRTPDQVVVLFCNNDLPENLDKKSQDPPRPYLEEIDGKFTLKNYPVPPSRGWSIRAWLKNKSLAYNHLYFHAMRARQALRDRRTRSASVANADRTTVEESPERVRQLRALKTVYGQMRELCDLHDVRLAVAAWQPEELAVVSRVCGELGIPVLDLTPRFERHYQSSDEPAPVCFKTDPHFNTLGHQFLAEGIRTELDRLLLGRE